MILRTLGEMREMLTKKVIDQKWSQIKSQESQDMLLSEREPERVRYEVRHEDNRS